MLTSALFASESRMSIVGVRPVRAICFTASVEYFSMARRLICATATMWQQSIIIRNKVFFMLQSYNLLRRFVVTLHKIGGASAIKVNFIALGLHYFCIK